MMLSLSLLVFLLPSLTRGSSILSLPQSLVPVECPSSVTTFAITTEVTLEGRNELLTSEERARFSQIFQGIYNAITKRSCDSYFRRINKLSWIQISNNLGQVLPLGTMMANNATATTSINATSSSVNTRHLQGTITSLPGLSVVYQVTGQCRSCPVARGNFELYDDAFRRALQGSLRQLQSSNVNNTHDYGGDDCECVAGVTPTTPQAPGEKECVDEMNLEFESTRAESGLFENLTVTDLKELRDCGVVVLDTVDVLRNNGDVGESQTEVNPSFSLEGNSHAEGTAIQQSDEASIDGVFVEEDVDVEIEMSSAAGRRTVVSPLVFLVIALAVSTR